MCRESKGQLRDIDCLRNESCNKVRRTFDVAQVITLSV